ncbi:hypothetical protein [Vogesella oryzae]|uniref:hypothetical protein n=1 Tax=Vogesella oryzae TaxID=1735285 RepID=UPI0015817247|nr:hypothetical protein [Vogesella oryzae]
MGQMLDKQVSDLLSRRDHGLACCDVKSSSVRLQKLPLGAEQALQLQALAQVLDASSECLGGQLLAAAVGDLWDKLDEPLRSEAVAAFKAIQQAGKPETIPGVEFNLGGS